MSGFSLPPIPPRFVPAFDLYGPLLRNTAGDAERTSGAHAALVKDALERALADLRRIAAMPAPHAEAAAAALRAQAQAQAADQHDRPQLETK